MQQTLEQSNVGSHSGHSQDAVECIQSLPSIITFPTISPKENFVDSDRFAEDDKLIFKTGGFHSIEVKTEEEIEMFNESEEDNEEEYVIVEDAEKYQIIPVEQDYKVFSNVIYFDGPWMNEPFCPNIFTLHFMNELEMICFQCEEVGNYIKWQCQNL